MKIVTLGLIVAMVGTLAVLGVLGVRKYLKGALTNEAKNTLGQIAKDAVAAHEGKKRVCPSASKPVPGDISLIRGRKYPSSRGDWEVDKARNAGFACLDFEMTAPQYYQYRYEATATSFLAGARGDLDADGDLANFTITGEVRDGRLVVSPSIEETDPAE